MLPTPDTTQTAHWSVRFRQPRGTVDVLYAYSVWSHMTPEDVAGYAKIIASILRPDGKAMLSAFVEDDVPDWTENPDDYGTLTWAKPLHCARFERNFFYQLMD